MKTVTAFVAKSFRAEDRRKAQIVEQFLGRFHKLGFVWKTAEAAEVESVSHKVRNLIDSSDAFVGILTKRHPLFEDTRGLKRLVRFIERKPSGWSAPPWVLQESGYALKAGKPLILFRETGVDIGGLQGDLEYIPYDPNQPDAAFARAQEMIHDLIAKESNVKVEVITQAANPPSESAPNALVPAVDNRPADSNSDLHSAFDALSAAIGARNLDAAAAALNEGLNRIPPANRSRITMWKSLYFAWTYQIGRESSSTDLAELQKQNPTDPTPTVMLAGSYRYFQQYEKAADAYAQASQIATEDDSRRFRIRSAECLRSAKRLADARSQLERLLGITELPLTTRIEALKELYSVLKDSFEVEYAFAVGELILFDNPGDIDFRFTIGYDYLNHHPSMAVYHYELVCEKEPDSVALNNLGYAYKETDFPIYAARKYREAANLKEARAFRNLALNYVNSGFADDALALLASAEEANAPDPEGLIAQATATVYEQISGERDRHQQAMESTRSYRGFLPRMGKALFESFDFVIDGNWVFPAGQVTLIHTKGQVHGTGEEGYRLTNWGLRALAGASPGKGKKTFTFAGQVTGRVCQFIMTATIVHDDPLTFDPTEEPVHGYVIFDGDGEHAEVSEYKDEKPTSFYTISKAS